MIMNITCQKSNIQPVTIMVIFLIYIHYIHVSIVNCAYFIDFQHKVNFATSILCSKLETLKLTLIKFCTYNYNLPMYQIFAVVHKSFLR